MATTVSRGTHRGFGLIRIQVTDPDIKKANKANSMRCVVAQAIARTIPDATRIDVDTQAIRWSQGGERHVYLTPYAVQGYVVAFDAGDEIHPFSFSLDNRKRVPVRTKVKTEAGKITERARNKKTAAERRKTRITTDATAPEQLAEAETEVAKAKADFAAVTAAYADQPKTQITSETRRHSQPRVFKTSERAYGMRKLRINQQTS